jgi:hypothetical protein
MHTFKCFALKKGGGGGEEEEDDDDDLQKLAGYT